MAFLTVAAWFALSALLGAEMTALCIGAAYLGAGLILIGTTGRGDGVDASYSEQRTAPRQDPDQPPVMQAFMYGLHAGTQANQRRHS
ncbi:hypothetical protein [Yoonia sp. 2307UL14-13]|uniref:hypothetical protein n=1 Tax=Yoonia sp. 2307UL14-13 TaxID=3126506 RepID=UPI0030AFC68D